MHYTCHTDYYVGASERWRLEPSWIRRSWYGHADICLWSWEDTYAPSYRDPIGQEHLKHSPLYCPHQAPSEKKRANKTLQMLVQRFDRNLEIE